MVSLKLKFKILNSITENQNFDEDGIIKNSIPTAAYEKQSLNDELEKINIEEGYFSEADYPSTSKPNFQLLVVSLKLLDKNQ